MTVDPRVEAHAALVAAMAIVTARAARLRAAERALEFALDTCQEAVADLDEAVGLLADASRLVAQLRDEAPAAAAVAA